MQNAGQSFQVALQRLLALGTQKQHGLRACRKNLLGAFSESVLGLFINYIAHYIK